LSSIVIVAIVKTHFQVEKSMDITNPIKVMCKSLVGSICLLVLMPSVTQAEDDEPITEIIVTPTSSYVGITYDEQSPSAHLGGSSGEDGLYGCNYNI
jgi:hypothetical protein